MTSNLKIYKINKNHIDFIKLMNIINILVYSILCYSTKNYDIKLRKSIYTYMWIKSRQGVNLVLWNCESYIPSICTVIIICACNYGKL